MMLPEHIRLSDNPGSDLSEFITKRRYKKIAILTDENTARLCYPLIEKYLPVHNHISVPAGEEHKTLSTCTIVWKAMTDAQLDRKSLLIVVGGGMPGDLGGFCAATFKRGIDFVLVPTTLLAQADASIGGKTGIDFDSYKNHIGVFRQPALTLIAPVFLNTLPEAELRSGLAEIIKHALISDKDWWQHLIQKSWKELNWSAEIEKSARFKWKVVSEDPHEQGMRKILNAGHTVGHAIESWFLSSGKPILHGDAVAAGLVCEAIIARNLKLLPAPACLEICNYLLKVFGKLKWPSSETANICSLCFQDKKNEGKEILMALPEETGRVRWDYAVAPESITQALNEYLML